MKKFTHGLPSALQMVAGTLGWAMIALLAAALPATGAQAATTWTLASGFSTDTNPNGTWSWGQSDTAGDLGSFTAFAWHGISAVNNTPIWCATSSYASGAHIWENTLTTASYGAQPGDISFHPGPDSHLSVVRWTSPIAGAVNILGSFGQGDSGNVDVYLVKTDGAGSVTQSFLSVLNTAAAQNFYVNATVAVGNTIDFAVGNAGNWSSDNTPLAVTITPEPATLALLALGGAAAMARRRRQAAKR
jgi:hypothetical protein